MGVRSCPVTRESQEFITIITAIVTLREPNHKVSPTSSTWSYFKVRYVTQVDLMQDNLWTTCYKGTLYPGIRQYLTAWLSALIRLSELQSSDSTGCDFI